ncbi:MAG: MFS transporter [Opitutia bacterium Tous-C1TDCM]|nr:MAG: MFS transporter [Opitutae bacterium Tous-C1TDCM]
MPHPSELNPLDRARRKAYLRLLPLLFLAYVIAFVDRTNVAIAKLTMTKDIPGFDNAVIGFGAGIFFLGYFLLEIPGSIIVEKWSARLWIFRIMVTWGIMASLTAFVGTPIAISEWIVGGINSTFGRNLGVPEFQFYAVRFLLGLAEAGFFPGVLVYLTHWFPAKDRARALALFLIATPFAQIVSPKLSFTLLKIGTTEVVDGVTIHHPEVLGLEGWQWVYLVWGLPAVILGFVILIWLPDRPKHAAWLSAEERDALENQLAADRAHASRRGHLSLLQGLRHPKVLLLSLTYFLAVTGSYGVMFFLPSILDRWYQLKYDSLAWLVILPPITAVLGQLVVGWSSDRTKERRLHTVVPILAAAGALALAPLTQGHLWLTLGCFMVAMGGLKAYQPAFWTMPNLFLTSTAAAGSLGMINSIGNLGGQLGPYLIGKIETLTGSFAGGLYCLAGSVAASAVVVFFLGVGNKPEVGSAPEGKQ